MSEERDPMAILLYQQAKVHQWIEMRALRERVLAALVADPNASAKAKAKAKALRKRNREELAKNRALADEIEFMKQLLKEFAAHPECKTYADLKAAHKEPQPQSLTAGSRHDS